MDPVDPLTLPGARFAGRYEIVQEVGAGGMGTVYRAIDIVTQAPVAVKIVHVTERADEIRFEREAAALRGVNHPAVVSYLGHGRDRGVHYLVMAWLSGRTLDDHLADVGLTPAESVAFVTRIASGLAAVHARGLVHRDIKPKNLLLVDGDPAQVTILDFGVARSTDRPTIVTHTGRAIGTPGYMSPEQARGERGLDARSDVFSLACVLYECLSGRTPFPGDHATAVYARVLLHEPKPLGALCPEAPLALCALVDACLSKDRRRRPADGGELAQRLVALPPLDPALPRRLHTHAMATVAVGPARTPAALISILVAQPATPPTGLTDLARRLGARADVISDGTVLVELAGGTATDHAVAVTSLVAALEPGVLAIATGEDRGDRGDDIAERAARLFDHEALAAALPSRTPRPGRGAVRSDDATVALLAPPLEAIGGPARYLLTRAAPASPAPADDAPPPGRR
jgi:eukaryotic-like serine/threonine-protein kinase